MVPMPYLFSDCLCFSGTDTLLHLMGGVGSSLLSLVLNPCLGISCCLKRILLNRDWGKRLVTDIGSGWESKDNKYVGLHLLPHPESSHDKR